MLSLWAARNTFPICKNSRGRRLVARVDGGTFASCWYGRCGRNFSESLGHTAATRHHPPRARLETPSRAVNENAPHRFRSSSEEMLPPVPLTVRIAGEL